MNTRAISRELVARYRLLQADTSTDRLEDVTFHFKKDNYSDIPGFAVIAKHPRLGTVGLVTAHLLDTDTPSDEYSFGGDLLPIPWEDSQRFKKRVFGVRSSWVDRRFRGEGMGQSLYLILLWELSKKDAGLVPNSSFGGDTATSPSALRVWKHLAHEGVAFTGAIAWGGRLDRSVYHPLRNRRPRGFRREKPKYKRA